MSKPLVKKVGSKYQITEEGLVYVTELLQELGFFPEPDTKGFKPDSLWAGIMGTYMAEAADRYLTAMGSHQDELDEDALAEVTLVALYASVASAEGKKNSKHRKRPND